MLCEVGKELHRKFEQADRERRIEEKEVEAELANKEQSGLRLAKMREIANAAKNAFNRHQDSCAICGARGTPA